MSAQLAHWDKDRTRGNISLYFLGLSLPLVLMQYLAGYYTGPVLQGLIPCLLGCGVGLVISYPLARKIGEGPASSACWPSSSACRAFPS